MRGVTLALPLPSRIGTFTRSRSSGRAPVPVAGAVSKPAAPAVWRAAGETAAVVLQLTKQGGVAGGVAGVCVDTGYATSQASSIQGCDRPKLGVDVCAAHTYGMGCVDVCTLTTQPLVVGHEVVGHNVQ